MSDIFQNLNNPVVNPDNPWLPYKNADSEENWEFHDGDWFRNAATDLAETDPTIFDLGIILYTDKTGSWCSQSPWNGTSGFHIDPLY